MNKFIIRSRLLDSWIYKIYMDSATKHIMSPGDINYYNDNLNIAFVLSNDNCWTITFESEQHYILLLLKYE